MKSTKELLFEAMYLVDELAEGCEDTFLKAKVNKLDDDIQQALDSQAKADGSPEILPLVIQDMKHRGEIGRKKYGQPLTANNGRDALRDAYEEAMDLCQYLRQAIEERQGGKERGDHV